MKKATKKPIKKSLLTKTGSKAKVIKDIELDDYDMVVARAITKEELRMARNLMRRTGDNLLTAAHKLGFVK